MDIKELIKYLFSKIKIWVIINEWESGIHLRNGKIKRTVSNGMYLRLPIIDAYYSQPNRTQAIQAEQISLLTKDKVQYSVSGSVWYRINDIRLFYTSYSEPSEVISDSLRTSLVHSFGELLSEQITPDTIEELVYSKLEQGKGVEYDSFRVTTITSARTYRIIKDDLYGNKSNELKSAIN
jgi:regulator of protease activity HflC (stomatin/prohibitin superfamily)